MGKKARKTRWRTLAIADEQSDSEESNTTTAPRLPNAYQQKSHYNRVPYSSQSTPRRRYQHDGTKSTRSSSTASENKITFNEDEYTRITTPRQDVLFKKGYLNKPRSYQTQTSTGTSTTSTGNSTGNGTPDHQSTDLEYESQFVFPNGFVDQNGIYYVNSFEPYPLMLYNPPTYYTEFSNCKSKRYSTGSLTESTSPNNEEATSQDMSGGEASNNVSEYSSHHSVYSMYPDYYANGNCPPQEIVNEHCPVDEIRKIKKRRRRKTSKSLAAAQDSSECSEDEGESCTEESRLPFNDTPSEITTTSTQPPEPPSSEIPPSTEETSSEVKIPNGCAEETVKAEEPVLPEDREVSTEVSTEEGTAQVQLEEPPKPLKYDLKPDAEEFVPRAYRAPEIPLNPIQFIKVPPNFVHIPVVPYNGQNFNPAFIPSGIPIHFLPPDRKMFSNFVEFAPNIGEAREVVTEITSVEENRDGPVTAKAPEVPVCKGAPESQRTIDIATVVSKLEEAAKELVEVESVQSPKRNNEYKASPGKYKNTYKRSFYNSARSSPQRQVHQNGTSQEPEPTQTKDIPEGSPGNDRRFNRYSPEKFKKNWKAPNYQNGANRWQQNGVQKSPEFKQRQSPRIFSETKQNNRNYSDTLRNSKPVAATNGDVAPEAKTDDAKTPKQSPKTSATLPITPNQWISVSSKKKRKNRNAEESDTATLDQEEPTTVGVDDDFEVYDIDQLVDVMVPPTVATEEIIKVEITEGKVEEIINTIAESLPVSSEMTGLITNMRSVTDIESELISKDPERNAIPEREPPAIETTEEFVAVSKPKSKKKSKKSAPKAVTKRVIITDIDLSEKCEPVKTPAKQPEQIEEKPVVVTPKIVEPTVEEVDKEPSLVAAEAPRDNEEEEKKKSKKKKKKPAKSVAPDGAVAAPVATESYDFLLEASLVDEVDKTNDEISQELDKIIQKGMYSNLEEKMRSLNIDESDGFFKSVFSKITTRDGGERTGYAKTPDFTKIPLFKAAPVSEDHHLENKQSNTQLPASESPREDGIFLDNPDLNEMLGESDDVNKGIKLDDTDNTKDDKEEPRKLYPITAAVREWMSKTRETTPDVEILKSPKTIYEELQKNVGIERIFTKERSTSIDEEKEEITIFAKEEEREDLLDFWENEVTSQAEPKITNVVADMGETVEEGEDVLEVYESKYGRNEDFLNLQKEVREKAKSFSHPKHSNLPYRAVCCNVM